MQLGLHLKKMVGSDKHNNRVNCGMEKINFYKDIIQEELTYQASKHPSNAPSLEQQLIVDKERKHFLVMILGWHDYDYVHNCVFHVEVKSDMVYIHEDNTNIMLAERLIEKGIPKSSIIPAFMPSYERAIHAFAS